MTYKPNRRSFLIAGGLTALASTKVLGANDTIRIGVIGAGERMQTLLDCAAKAGPVQIVAVSDVYAPRRDAVKELSNGIATTHVDYHEVLEQGHRCRADRNTEPLARPHGRRCPGGRQRCLSGKAGHPHHRGRRDALPCGSVRQADSAMRHATAQLGALSRCGRLDSGWRSRTNHPGKDLLVAELSAGLDAKACRYRRLSIGSFGSGLLPISRLAKKSFITGAGSGILAAAL